MSAAGVMERVKHNAATMSGPLPSSKSIAMRDCVCGIHGAMRKRQGIKRGTSAARRRAEKEEIKQLLREYT